MSIVIDLGCHYYPEHPNDESVRALTKRFKPYLLLGFDPHPDMTEECYPTKTTTVVTRRLAASISDEPIPYLEAGISSRLHADGEYVPAFNLAELLRVLPSGLTVKMDVEGSEYLLLPHLIAHDIDTRIGRLLLEWHDGPAKIRDRILGGLRCNVEEW